MPARVRTIDAGAESSRRALATLCHELRLARLDRNLALADVARALTWSRSKASRVERNRMPNVSVTDLTRFGAAVGLEMSIRFYAGPHPVRDAAHIRLLQRFRARLNPGIRCTFEAPFPNPGDQRAWDAFLRGAGWTCGVEGETGPRDGQALNRRMSLKLRDGGADQILLVLPNTRRVRAFLAEAGPLLRATFDGEPRTVLARLAAGQSPSANAIIVL
jgi:transcriptional regulator with XRE-family HTH domain